MRVVVEFDVHDPLPVSQRDFDDILGELEHAGDSVGLELLSLYYDTPNAPDS